MDAKSDFLLVNKECGMYLWQLVTISYNNNYNTIIYVCIKLVYIILQECFEACKIVGNYIYIYIDFFAPSDCITGKYCPILTSHTSMESFIQLSDDV